MSMIATGYVAVITVGGTALAVTSLEHALARKGWLNESDVVKVMGKFLMPGTFIGACVYFVINNALGWWL